MCLSVGLSAFLSSSLLLPSFFSSLLLTFRLSFSSACFSLCFTFSYCRSLSSAGRSPLLFSPAGRERARARAQFPFGHQSPPILAWLLARILSGFVGFFWCLRLANFTVETSGLKGILQRRSEEFSRRFERIYRGWMAFEDFSGMLNNCSEILFRFFNVPREFCGDPIKTFWICSFFFVQSILLVGTWRIATRCFKDTLGILVSFLDPIPQLLEDCLYREFCNSSPGVERWIW